MMENGILPVGGIINGKGNDAAQSGAVGGGLVLAGYAAVSPP